MNILRLQQPAQPQGFSNMTYGPWFKLHMFSNWDTLSMVPSSWRQSTHANAAVISNVAAEVLQLIVATGKESQTKLNQTCRRLCLPKLRPESTA
jgi:hypothetical protein